MNRRSLMLVGVFVLLLFLVSCLPQKPLTDEELEAELTKLTPEEREVLVKDLESGDGALAGQASARTIPSRVKNVPKIRIIDAINNLPVPVPEPQCGSDQECPYVNVCIKNKCVPKPCKLNQDCPTNYGCENLVCKPSPLRTLTFAEMDKIDVTVPLLHISAVPSYNMYAWISDDNLAWEQIFQSDAHYLKNDTETEFYILLDRVPRYVRVEGKPYGGVAVDMVEIILPDGNKILPTSAKVNNADVVNVKGDKDYVELNLGLNFSLEFPINSQKYSLNLPKVPVNIPALGVYADSIGNSDSSYVPFNECTLDGKKGKGWIYYPNATDIAFYDFSIIQGNNNLNYNQKVHTLINVVKNVNSNQKVILRLALPAQVVLEYNYNESTRNYVKQNLLDQIKGGPLNLYGVTLSEEELAVQFSGFNGQSVPEWLNKYVPQYEAETNKKFETQNSQDVINWLSEKAKIFFNELHTYVKSNYPNIKVMQWVYIPGDNSGWAWIEPKALNKDGWIIQWHGDYKVSLLKPAVHKLSVITTVYVKERSFNIQTQKLRDAGVPNSEIYANINGYDAATMGTALWQLEMVREVGINNVFVFYYGAFVPPKPLTDCAPIFFNTSNGLVWKSSYDDRLKFENYSKNLK